MGKTREIACKFYINEGNCGKGHKGTFRQTCQTCPYYVPLKGAKPARTDNRKRKLEKIKNKEMRKWQD